MRQLTFVKPKVLEWHDVPPPRVDGTGVRPERDLGKLYLGRALPQVFQCVT